MRVLHVMASGARGGGVDHLCGLLPALRDLGVYVEVAVGSDGPARQALDAAGLQTHATSLMQGRLDPFALGDLLCLQRRVGADIVHHHGTRAAFYGAFAKQAPLVYTVHGLAYRQECGAMRHAALLLAEAWASQRADAVISVSRADLDDLRKRRLVTATKGHHVPNAIDLDRFRPRANRDARARLGLSGRGTVIGTVARLVPQKSVADLIDAVARVPRTRLVVVGDGPQRAELEQRARRLGCRAQFLGAREDVDRILPAFDVFALSSRWEGEPIALLEALACGLPVVATATAGAREVLGRTGLLVPVGDSAALAARLADLRDTSLRRKHAARSRQRVLGRSYASAAAQIASIYERILRHARAS